MYAAQTSFFIIVSFFPFLMLLLSLLNYTSIRESQLLTLITNIAPLKLQPLIISFLSEIYSSSSSTLLSITAISALWAAGKGFVSIIQGLNDIYDTGAETRNYFILRFHAIGYTLMLIFMIILTLIIMVFGNRLLYFLNIWWPFMATFISFILKFRVFLSALILTIFFVTIYKIVPNRKTKFSKEIPGALFSGLGWIIFSYIFSIYVDMSAGFAITYGSLTTLVFIMLWLYFCIMILFLGAEINSFINQDKYL